MSPKNPKPSLSARDITIRHLLEQISKRSQRLQWISGEHEKLTQLFSSQDRDVKKLSVQLAEKEQAAQALSVQLAEKEQAAQALSVQLAEKEQAAQALSVQLAEKEQAAQALSVQLAEKEQAAQALSAQLVVKEQAAQALSVQLAEKEQMAQLLSVQLAEKEQAAQSLSAQLAMEEQSFNSQVLQLKEEAQSEKLRSNNYEYIIEQYESLMIERDELLTELNNKAIRAQETLSDIYRSKNWRAAHWLHTAIINKIRHLLLISSLSPLLSLLDLKIDASILLRKLELHMTPADRANLVSLLSFVGKKRFLSANSNRQKVIRALDLPNKSYRSLERLCILFICGEFPNPIHGGGGRVFDLIRLLGQSHDVYLYAWYLEKQDSEALARLLPYCKKFKGVLPHEIEKGDTDIDIKQLMDGLVPDFVHYEWLRSLASHHPNLGRQHIFTFMESCSLRFFSDMALETPMSDKWLQLMVKMINVLKQEIVDSASLDARIVVTKNDGDFLSRFDRTANYYVVPTGITFDEFCLPEVGPEPNTLTFTGYFTHYPNEYGAMFFLDQIYPLIVREIPELKIYIVGANPTERLRARNDDNAIFVTGQVADVRPYIQRASVCLAPLINGAGLRGKVNQYAVLRRPCVATSIAAADLAYENEREIYVADDPEIFAERVVFLLKHPEHARNMGMLAYKKCQSYYDITRSVEGLYRIYDKMVTANFNNSVG